MPSKLKRIPVLISTSSQAEEDINECYDLGATCYLKKPMKFQDLCSMAEALSKFRPKEVTYAASGE